MDRKRRLETLQDLYAHAPPRRLSALLVEDDRDTAEPLAELLEHAVPAPSPGLGEDAAAWEIVWSATLAQAGAELSRRGFDLLIVDRNMTDGDGLTDFIVPLRRQGYRGAVLMLTQRGQREEELAGFQGGADDYVRKPLDAEVLLARVDALARPLRAQRLRRRGLMEIDFSDHGLARHAGRRLRLSPLSLRILAFLFVKAPLPATRAELLRHVWGIAPDPEPTPRLATEQQHARKIMLDVALSKLRDELEDEGLPSTTVVTARGSRRRGEPSGWRLGDGSAPTLPEPMA